jgi:hypothetical protein
VPLRGFIDLALQARPADELVLQSVDEIHVGLDRIAALAYQLESLAQQGAMLAQTTLGACLASTDQWDVENLAPVAWSCSQETPVDADADHARRAIISLVYMVGPGAALSVAETAMDGMVCAVCGKALASGNGFVEIEAHGVRPAIFAAIGAPFDVSQRLRAIQRLSLAALSHCVHMAGGHAVARPAAASLSIVLPKQRASRC